MRQIAALARFWWDFVIGDDWRVALGVVAGLALSALLVHESIAAWWLLPPSVLLILAASLRRAVCSLERQ